MRHERAMGAARFSWLRTMLWRGAALVLTVLGPLVPLAADEPDSAVILVYHRFGEDAYPSTSVTIEQFEQHLEILRDGDYQVLPLEAVVKGLAGERDLPDRTVAITVDDTYRSVITEALPRFLKEGFPFTVFVNTDAVNRSSSSFTWDDVRAMHEAGVTIAAQSAAHGHMAFMDRGGIEEDLARMTSDFIKEMGFAPKLFAYPFGEYSSELTAIVRNVGYDAAFGQHSGVAVEGSNLFTLPRFALNVRYGTIERFRTIVETLPFPVTASLPLDMVIRGASPNPPFIGFTVAQEVGSLDRLGCFASNGAEVMLEIFGRRVEMRLDRPFAPGRSRINCTLPAGEGRFRWLGIPFLVPGGQE